MTKIEVTQCDSCGFKQDPDTYDGDGIYECKICSNDYCDDCKDDHANEECWD